jgi:heavy metal translocating P-type ATPase
VFTEVMARARSILRAYPFVFATVGVAAVSLILLATPLAPVVRWIVTGYVVLAAIPLLVAMVRQALKREWGLDLLALIAIGSTLIVGEYWASIIIVLMLTGGEALEDFAASRAKRDLSSLLDRVPQIAHRFTATEDIADVAAADVVVGDRLLVRPSEVVPVDAVLADAQASVDESSLTGESLPAEKSMGDAIMSGSLNGARAMVVTATAIAAESQYQRIVELVSEAAQSKAPMVRLADRYAMPFTVVSLIIGGLAWFISGDPVRFAEVLVVATPCPLLLAAPVAFMAGMSNSARHGVVVKTAGTLEVLARAKTVAFDKTGTLTIGRPEVARVEPAAGFGENELRLLVGSAEAYSSHVLAEALVRAAAEVPGARPTVVDATELSAFGVHALVDGRTVHVGKPSFVAENSSGLVLATLGAGEAAVYAAVDGVFAGVIILRDAIRPEAAATLAALRRATITSSLMVTGDVEQTAQAIAGQLGITEVHAECLPADKVRIVAAASPRPVIMVGDGVNDAPVLAAADVGIAMGARGSTAASESADVVILVDDISRVATAVTIARRTVLIAVQSIWLGIAISVGLMLVASVGVLPAVIGAGLQEFVDLVTILNALRALRNPRGA